MHRSKRMAVPWLIFLVVAGSIFLAACGGSSSSSSSEETTSQEAPAETEGTEAEAAETEGAETEGGSAAGVSASTMKLALQFSGGKEGEADQSLSPIKIGFVNQEGQTFSFLEMKAAAEATVSFANKYLDGIEGHPLELFKCPLTGAEAQQRCAVQMLEAKVPVINFGLSAENPVAFTKTLAGKIPMQVALATGPATYAAPNTYTYYSIPAIFYGMGKAAKELTSESEKLSIAASNNAGGKIPTETIFLPILKELEVPANDPVYFPAATVTTPEMTSTLQAGGVSSAGALVSFPAGTTECADIYNSLKQLNPDIPVINSLGCTNSTAFEEAIGQGPEGWHVWGGGPLPQVEEPEPEAFVEIMKAGGQEKYVYEGWAGQEMGAMMVILKAANELGAEAVTAPALSEKFKEVKDPVFMSAPGINCAEPWESKSEPAVCGNGAVESVYENGKWNQVQVLSLKTENKHING
jgi:branched-chain amino acid transport system substrate-binding protein